MTARAFGIRFSTCYALMMMGSGVQLPFLPLWLHAKGLDVSQIATVVAAMMAVRVIGAPFFAYLADRTGNRLLVIRCCAVASLAAYMLLPTMVGISQILPVALAAGLLFAPVFPLTEGFSVDASAVHGLDYGRIRLWASLSFLTGSLISGALLTRLPAESTAWLIACAQAMAVLATFMLPAEPDVKSDHELPSTLKFVAALKFLFGSRFTVFLLAASLSNASHAMLFSFGSVHWAKLGFDTFTIGLFWACAVLAEVGLFAFSNRVIERFGSPMLLCAGLCGGILRWIGMSWASSGLAFGILQSLHAVSFACAHLALMHFIRLNVPSSLRNTAQGLYTALAGGVLLSSVTWASGPLYEAFGGHAYLMMAMISLWGLSLAASFMWLSPKEPVAVAA
jgi:MFS transporter, PPP family, 3-phenylpropionic acid transporter